MNASRLSLLGAFAGGCLSAGLLFGFGRADSGVAVPAQKHLADHSTVAASIVNPGTVVSTGQGRDATDEAARSPGLTAQAEPGDIAQPDALSAPSTAKDAQDVASAAPSPGGSAVSDVLTDLEAAYRQRLIAAARAEAEAAPERAATPASANAVVAAPEVAPRPVAPVPVSTVSAVSAPVPAAPPPSEPPAAPEPALVAQNDARPPDVHIGDVNQNTYNITNVRQGDVYVTQQLAMLQYMQFLGAASNAGLSQPAHAGRGTAQRSAPQFRQFPSTLTNLDNPWGFNFAPPNLVH